MLTITASGADLRGAEVALGLAHDRAALLDAGERVAPRDIEHNAPVLVRVVVDLF